MATVHIETQITLEDLLKAVGQLSMTDLERFAAQVLRLQAQRKAVSLPAREAELLVAINQGFPAAWRARYQALQVKLQAEGLSPEEEQEFFDLITRREKWQAQRLEALAELARLRNTTLRGVMKQLGIHSPGYV
jgi:sulfur carrier protein ThiS